jgi:hypothetical protein
MLRRAATNYVLDMGWAHVRAGAENRSAAEKLCANPCAAGVIYCEVQRN